MKTAMRYSFCVLTVVMFIMGCRSNNSMTHHISDNVDFSFVKKVAVMPLENETSERAADEIIRQLLMNELLVSGLVDVVIPGEVMTAVNGLGIKKMSSLDRKQIQDLGKVLGVQGIIMGAVQQYGQVQFGSVTAPEVTIMLMMADTGTGDIIWSVTKTRGGAGFMARHFGTKAKTMSETALAVVRDAVETLSE